MSLGKMSAQIVKMVASCPGLVSVLEKADSQPRAFQWVIVISALPPAQWTEEMIPVAGAEAQSPNVFQIVPFGSRHLPTWDFDSKTAALRASEAILKAKGFTNRGRTSVRGNRNEASHWGVWQAKGDIRKDNGRFISDVDGIVDIWQGIVPVAVPSEVPIKQEADQAEKKPLTIEAEFLPQSDSASMAENCLSAIPAQVTEPETEQSSKAQSEQVEKLAKSANAPKLTRTNKPKANAKA